MQTNRNSNSPWRAMGVVGVIGVELAVLLLLGLWLGKKLDMLLQTSPIFLILGMLLGLAIGVWSVIRIIKPYLGD